MLRSFCFRSIASQICDIEATRFLNIKLPFDISIVFNEDHEQSNHWCLSECITLTSPSHIHFQILGKEKKKKDTPWLFSVNLFFPLFINTIPCPPVLVPTVLNSSKNTTLALTNGTLKSFWRETLHLNVKNSLKITELVLWYVIWREPSKIYVSNWVFYQSTLKEKGIDKLLDDSRKEAPFPSTDQKQENTEKTA